jgi:hypothetical protein
MDMMASNPYDGKVEGTRALSLPDELRPNEAQFLREHWLHEVEILRIVEESWRILEPAVEQATNPYTHFFDPEREHYLAAYARNTRTRVESLRLDLSNFCTEMRLRLGLPMRLDLEHIPPTEEIELRFAFKEQRWRVEPILPLALQRPRADKPL